MREVAPQDWDALLARLGVTDTYVSRGYVEASAPLAGGEPVYLCEGDEDGAVVLAGLLRSDPVDLVTPYGYGGPLAAGAAPPVARFAGAYGDWCTQHGVVSSFVVYHPLAGNADLAAATGFHRADLAGTVAWRLDGEGDLLDGMHAHHRRRVRRAERAGLTVSVTPDATDLAEFAAVYEVTMARAGAADFYLFDEAYWRALADGVPLVRVDVRAGDELVAGVLGFGSPPWLHYHLGASTDRGRDLGASHLALLTLARHGRAHGHEVLHLGGGVGGRADSLLTYKERFAPGGLVPAAIGKAVHDREAYARLTGAPDVDWDGFFPAYRAGG